MCRTGIVSAHSDSLAAQKSFREASLTCMITHLHALRLSQLYRLAGTSAPTTISTTTMKTERTEATARAMIMTASMRKRTRKSPTTTAAVVPAEVAETDARSRRIGTTLLATATVNSGAAMAVGRTGTTTTTIKTWPTMATKEEEVPLPRSRAGSTACEEGAEETTRVL